MSVSDILEVEIEKLVSGGYGLAHSGNLTIFVPLASRKDKLKVKIYKKNSQAVFAEIIEILNPSTTRQQPKCCYFGECGGCNFQHLPYQSQLDEKVEIIRDCFRRIGKIDVGEIKVIASQQAWNYRLRAQWHIDTRTKHIGYFKRNSNDVVDVESCPILAPKLQEFLGKLRSQMAYLKSEKEKIHLDVATDGIKVSTFSEDLPSETIELSVKVGTEKYFFNSKVFFQANRFLLKALIEAATEQASGENALDLYCGVGFFTLPLARKFKNVVAIEENPEAIKFARKNAKLAKLRNIEFFSTKVKNFLTEDLKDASLAKLDKLDFVLLDPPRTGNEKKVLEKLIELAPQKICYVSCDPATLARDLKELTENYEIISIVAIDLFPQTHHIETVVRLQKR
jgi:23S rRNA (uracil1939-C5)-methyltransferase